MIKTHQMQNCLHPISHKHNIFTPRAHQVDYVTATLPLFYNTLNPRKMYKNAQLPACNILLKETKYLNKGAVSWLQVNCWRLLLPEDSSDTISPIVCLTRWLPEQHNPILGTDLTDLSNHLPQPLSCADKNFSLAFWDILVCNYL